MKTSKGGTDIYCPNCQAIKTCKAVPAAYATGDSDDYVQRRYFTEHSDIQYFQRGRECLSCGNIFLTGELDLDFLNELIELRNALSDIKQNAEKYIQESGEVSKTLKSLSKSMSVLRALNNYKKS